MIRIEISRLRSVILQWNVDFIQGFQNCDWETIPVIFLCINVIVICVIVFYGCQIIGKVIHVIRFIYLSYNFWKYFAKFIFQNIELTSYPILN